MYIRSITFIINNTRVETTVILFKLQKIYYQNLTNNIYTIKIYNISKNS